MKTLLAVLLTVFLMSCSSTDADKQRYWAWYDSLTPAQQAMEDQRKHERELAAMHALGQMNFGRSPLGEGYTWGKTRYQEPQLPVYHPRPYTPPQRCVSRAIGGQVYTDCQ